MMWLNTVPLEPVDLTWLGEHEDLVSKMICDIRERWSAQELLEHPHFKKMVKEFQHDLELMWYGKEYRLTEDIKNQMYAEHEKRMSQKVDKETMSLVKEM